MSDLTINQRRGKRRKKKKKKKIPNPKNRAKTEEP
jgi:hypothetical protein